MYKIILYLFVCTRLSFHSRNLYCIYTFFLHSKIYQLYQIKQIKEIKEIKLIKLLKLINQLNQINQINQINQVYRKNQKNQKNQAQFLTIVNVIRCHAVSMESRYLLFYGDHRLPVTIFPPLTLSSCEGR